MGRSKARWIEIGPTWDWKMRDGRMRDWKILEVGGRCVSSHNGVRTGWAGLFSGVPPGPVHERKLQWDAGPNDPNGNVGEGVWVESHVGMHEEKDCEHEYDAPGGEAADAGEDESIGDEHAKAAEDLCEAADIDQHQGPGQVGRHDSDIGGGMGKVIDPG